MDQFVLYRENKNLGAIFRGFCSMSAGIGHKGSGFDPVVYIEPLVVPYPHAVNRSVSTPAGVF